MSSLDQRLNQILNVKHQIIELKIIDAAKQPDIGVQFEDGFEIEILNSERFATVDPNELFYYYDGPADDKTREFCLELLLLGKFFRPEDIDRLSKKAGYNVEQYKGSYNCRHKWVKARIKGKIKDGYVPKNPTNTDINKIGRKSIKKNND